ncbi:MAG: beta-galactosidase [Armatimonadia bacterium]
MRVMLLLATLAAGAVWAQTVPNGGFEQGTDQPTVWSWRTGEGGQGVFEWSKAPVHSGERSMRVKRSGAAGYTALDSDYVPVTAGKTYRISAWVFPVKPVRRGVYFMITQHKPDSDADQVPNAFGRTSQALVQQTWQQMTIKVPIREGMTRIRIHCIQAMQVSDLYWDDFAIAEDTAEEKPRYEPPTKETVPDLAQVQAEVAKRPRATAKLEMRGERARLIVDGKAQPFAWYVSAFGGPGFFENTQIGDFKRAGVHTYLVPLVLGNGLYGAKGPWLGKDQYDFSVVDDLIWRVLRVDPQGQIVFYMCSDPYPAWGAENPNDVTWDQDGKKAIVWMHPKRWGDDPQANERFAPSIVSHKMRDDVAATLKLLVKHVESSEAGKAVIGYHVAGFNDGQWFPWHSLNPADLHLADYSPGAQAAYRDWVKRKYGTVENLRRAWNNPQAAFETVTVPGMDKLWAESVYVDPKTEQDVADYQRFFSEGVAENIMYLAGTIKRESKRPVICGTYYEDITCNSVNHIALGQFLNSGEIDYLAGPAAYAIRMAGYQGAVRNVFGSTVLHGKSYLTEQDWRSWHSVPSDIPENNFSWGRAETAEVHNAMVRRECGMMLAFGLGTWWYDMSGGWFRDDQIMAGIAEAVRAFNIDLVDKDLPQADLAVFVSEESDSYIRMRYGGPYRYQGVSSQIEELNTAGVPYRLYLQSDLGKMKLPEHKAYLFLNPYFISPAERKAIEGLKREGKLLAFVGSPGRVGADPAQAASEITGIKLRPLKDVLAQQAGADAVVPDLKHPLLVGIEDSAIMAAGAPAEALTVVDPAAKTLAAYSDQASAVGCAARDFGKWKSVFIGSAGINADFLHNLAQWGGCWTTSAPGDAVYASQHFLTVHALFPGHKVLKLRQPAKVVDLTSGKVVAERATQIELDMERGTTRWFRLQ